jgi:MoaA/NifB/PqqE/SkfB family radical SAM enzyme
MTPEVHDASRGTPGSLEKTMKAILKINQLRAQRPGERLWLNIETILMPQNIHEILPLIDWAKRHGLDSIDVQILEDRQTFYAFSNGKSIRQPTDYCPPPSFDQQWNARNRESLLKVLDELIRRKAEESFIATPAAQLRATKTYLQHRDDILRISCKVGVDSFIIDPYGKVRLCMNMASIGSLLEQSPKQLWFSRNARLQRHQIKHCTMFCRLLTCNFSDEG